MKTLKGWRTYLSIGIGIIVLGMQEIGYIDSTTANLIATICGFFGIYFRSRATK